MNVGQHHLFAIHLLTASGAALALLSALAAFQGDWSAVFIWLGLALLVDGVDGPLARRYRVRERLPKWDGAAIDVVIDYTTYVFVPAIIVARALELTPLLGAALGIVVAVTAALYYADTRMKQPDNSFRGFPVVWNMAVFVLFAFLPPPEVTTAVILVLAILTFMPINFVHPVRVERWRRVTLAMLAVWVLSGAWLLATDFTAPDFVTYVLLAASLYLFGVSAVQQFLKSPLKKPVEATRNDA
jgi:phosphatidylcholine synthase